jgi:hypothetical protein
MVRLSSLACFITFLLIPLASATYREDCEFGSCPNIDPDETDLAIITAGNSGVGKSFIDNLIVGEEVFLHKYRASSVTRETEAVVTNINGKLATVYNIPGLIESNKENIEKNKAEIEKAFLGRAAQVIIFVFGVGDGGRIRQEDYASYLAMNEAYEFSRYSLIFVFNNVKIFDTVEERDEYQAMAVINLKELLKWPDSEPFRTIFAESFTKPFELSPQVAIFRMKLMRAILSCVPFRHEKKHDIELNEDKFKRAKIALGILKQDYEQLKAKHDKEILDLQKSMEQERVANSRRLDELQNKLNAAAAAVAASSKKKSGFGFSFGPISFQIEF